MIKTNITFPKAQAFTLMETMVALTIISITLIMFLPMISQFNARAKADAIKFSLLSAIATAQAAARTRQVPVILCPSSDQHSCSSDWLKGLLIFADISGDGMMHTHDQLIQAHPGKDMGGKLNWRSFPVYRHYLLFPASGMLREDNASFWYCQAKSPLPVWAVFLSKTGKTRLAVPDQNGVIKDSHGVELKCE